MKWISPDLWLDSEAARIRRRNFLKWFDRAAWMLISAGACLLVYHLVALAYRLCGRG